MSVNAGDGQEQSNQKTARGKRSDAAATSPMSSSTVTEVKLQDSHIEIPGLTIDQSPAPPAANDVTVNI